MVGETKTRDRSKLMENLKFRLANGSVRRKVLAPAVGLLSLMVLAVMAYSQKGVLLSYSWHLNWWSFSMAAMVFGIDLMLVASTWAAIMHSLGTRLAYSTHIRYYCLANVGKRLPGTIWYVAGRSYLYNKDGVGVGLVSVGSGLEFLVALLSGIVVSLLFGFSTIGDIRTAVGGFVIAFAVLLILFHVGGLRTILRKIGVANTDFISLSRFGSWLVVYSAAWILGGILLYLIANTVTAIEIDRIGFFIEIWSVAGVLSSGLFFLPLNMGVTAVTISLLLTAVVPSPVAVAITVLLWFAVTVFELIAATVCWWLISTRSRVRSMRS